jgi:hypothetical protein
MKRCLVTNGWSKARIQAAVLGLRRRGYAIDVLRHPSDVEVLLAKDCEYDMALASGDKPEWIPAREQLAARGIPTLVLDLGYLRRASGPRDRDGYNQAGWGGLCRPPERSFGPTRLAALGIRAEPNARGRDTWPWLVCAQVPGDTQHHLSREALSEWLFSTAYAARKPSYIWRPHPLAPIDSPSAEWPTQHGKLVPLADALRTVGGMITYNSTSAVEAIIAGIPVLCATTAHFAHVARADQRARQAYLERLAWGQFTCPEFESGWALEVLESSRPG